MDEPGAPNGKPAIYRGSSVVKMRTYLSSRLADAGARVIKIERPEGDFARNYDSLVHGESAYFVWLNRGKESICLDLKAPDDLAVLRAMVAKADIFIQNLAPGAIDRLGFAPEKLRAENPRLITCSISGYGDEGPYRDLKAYDLLVQAETGLSSITGNEHGSARVGVSVCDIAARHDGAPGGDAGALCPRALRHRPAHRGVALSCALRLDERAVPAICLWRQGAGAGGAQPSHHRALWRL